MNLAVIPAAVAEGGQSITDGKAADCRGARAIMPFRVDNGSLRSMPSAILLPLMFALAEITETILGRPPLSSENTGAPDAPKSTLQSINRTLDRRPSTLHARSSDAVLTLERA
ncbi:MAG: hypothetical protein JJ992_13650 [Planctomycetes bacterium]|nr:hypothetical protein [Planctomycetota bacterium]